MDLTASEEEAVKRKLFENTGVVYLYPWDRYTISITEEEMEITKTLDYSSIADAPDQTFNRYGTTFTRYYAASELYTYDEMYKVVTISVTWTTVGGKQEKVQVYSIVNK